MSRIRNTEIRFLNRWYLRFFRYTWYSFKHLQYIYAGCFNFLRSLHENFNFIAFDYCDAVLKRIQTFNDNQKSSTCIFWTEEKVYIFLHYIIMLINETVQWVQYKHSLKQLPSVKIYFFACLASGLSQERVWSSPLKLSMENSMACLVGFRPTENCGFPLANNQPSKSKNRIKN